MFDYSKKYDVIVIGGGHAGYEACLASAKMGCQTLLVTINIDTIGLMSCNPAIGGLAKGQLVKEIDALGGIMGRAIDATALQFRMLNTKRGTAVRSSRAQADRQMYRLWIKHAVENAPNLDIKQAVTEKILAEHDRAIGVETSLGERYYAKAVIIATGTFLNGLIHIGLSSFPAGRLGELPSAGISHSLRELGFELGRLKTGTTPRLDARSINFDAMERQEGDCPPRPFSFSTKHLELRQLPCYITYTNTATHDIIRQGFDRSPLYTGIIQGTGARYCPSIEDKVKRFPEKIRHQVFIEPEGYQTNEVYPNGIPTSLPLDIQIRMVQSIQGLESAEIMRPGYAIEYDYANPVQIKPTLETKKISCLYFAGQINGTSGYEEAGAQGLLAGINAALKVKGEKPFILDRSEAYIGVLIDDLVTKGTLEPYRMFTSRAEYRLVLREDNADLRLMEKGYHLGLVDNESFTELTLKKERIEKELKRIRETKVPPSAEVQAWLGSLGTSPLKEAAALSELLKRPEIDYSAFRQLKLVPDAIPGEVIEQVEIQIKYDGYIQRQQLMIEKFKRLEETKIPEAIDYYKIPSLTAEVREKFHAIRPLSLGQASRIAGITPAAISILMIYLKKYNSARAEDKKLKSSMMLPAASKSTAPESPPDRLAPELIKAGLAASIIAKKIYYFKSIDSTNRIAKEYAQAGAADGALVIAEEQTGGRGRLNRSWISPAYSNILCSCILYPKISPSAIFRITMLASIGVVRAIYKTCGIIALIKWPNDVYIDNKKVCGILTEFDTAHDKILYAVIGIGINVNFSIEKCPEISDSAVSLSTICGSSVSRLILLKTLLEELDILYLDFIQSGGINFRSEWERHSMILNRPVEIISGDEIARGIARGINEDGHLLIEDSGLLKTILCGDVSLRLEKNA